MEKYIDFVEMYYYPYTVRIPAIDPDEQLVEEIAHGTPVCFKIDSNGEYSSATMPSEYMYTSTYIDTCHYIAGIITSQITDAYHELSSGHEREIYLEIFRRVLEKDPRILLRVDLTMNAHFSLSEKFELREKPDLKDAYYKQSMYTNIYEFRKDNTGYTRNNGVVNPHDVELMGCQDNLYEYYHHVYNIIRPREEYLVYDMSIRNMGKIFEFLQDS